MNNSSPTPDLSAQTAPVDDGEVVTVMIGGVPMRIHADRRLGPGEVYVVRPAPVVQSQPVEIVFKLEWSEP